MENIVDYQESEPYLEAQQYIERMKQEDEGISMKSVGLDVSDHRLVGLDVSDLSPTVFPVSPLSHATVQWDAPETPETPAEAPSPGSHPELDYADGPAFDWTLNLPSADLSYIPNQDGVFDLPAEAESEEDVRLASSQVLYI